MRLGVCIDSAIPRDQMRVMISQENGLNEQIYMSKRLFEAIFRTAAREGLYLEIDIEDMTEERRANAKALQDRILRRQQDGMPR